MNENINKLMKGRQKRQVPPAAAKFFCMAQLWFWLNLIPATSSSMSNTFASRLLTGEWKSKARLKRRKRESFLKDMQEGKGWWCGFWKIFCVDTQGPLPCFTVWYEGYCSTCHLFASKLLSRKFLTCGESPGEVMGVTDTTVNTDARRLLSN